MDDLRRDAELLLARPDAGRPPTIRRVAAAWLAEHPADDGELVTEEWLMATLREARHLDWQMVSRNNGELWISVAVAGRGSAGVRVDSRKQVRALLAVLGDKL